MLGNHQTTLPISSRSLHGELKVELEYNEELDEHFIVIPESMLRNLDWSEGDMLDYEIVDDGVLTIFKI
jgi:hypothetical protein